MDNYQTYDQICYALFTDITNYALSHEKVIHIKGYNPKDYDHKLIFAIAKSLQGIYDFQIEIEYPKWKTIFQKKYKNVSVKKQISDGIYPNTLANYACEWHELPKTIIKEIYDTYYKG